MRATERHRRPGSQAAKVFGVSKVLHADNPTYAKWVAENISRAVAAVQVRVSTNRAVRVLDIIYYTVLSI